MFIRSSGAVQIIGLTCSGKRLPTLGEKTNGNSSDVANLGFNMADVDRTVAIEKREKSLFLPGTSEEYFLEHIRTLWITGNELEVSRQVDRNTGLPISTVSGWATLDKDSLGVIGDKSNNAKRLVLRIFGCEWPLTKPADAVEASRTELGDTLPDFRRNDFGHAELGFTSADWEIGLSDEWWIQLSIPHASLESLTKAILAGEANTISAGAHFAGLYVHDKWAPPSVHVSWFLRPSEDSNDLDRPEIVFGSLSYCSWKRMAPRLGLGGSSNDPDDLARPVGERTNTTNMTESQYHSPLLQEQNGIAARQLKAIWVAIGLAVVLFLLR